MKKEFLLSIIISFTFLTLGFSLLHYELIGYGVSFFVFLPFILGYILGKSTFKMVSLVGLGLSLFIFFMLLLAGALEGMVCILTAMPLVFIAVGIGAWVKYIANKSGKKEGEDNITKRSIIPFCIFLIFSFFETKLTEDIVFIEEVRSEIILPYSPMEVYNAIKSVDTLIAKKPFLMKLDLPVPHKCILEDEKVGGIRTCYFDGGKIVEQITEITPGKTLRMDVIDYQLTGRKWLGFKEAIYHFEALEKGHTKMTRITTYSSVLYPRFYWRLFEQMGIEQEHQYVFDNLRRGLTNSEL